MSANEKWEARYDKDTARYDKDTARNDKDTASYDKDTARNDKDTARYPLNWFYSLLFYVPSIFLPIHLETSLLPVKDCKI